MQRTPNYMPQKTLVAILIGSLILTGCGGGGGGGSSSGGSTPTAVAPGTPVQPPPATLNPVPYHTPERAGSYQPVNSTNVVRGDISAMYSQDLNSDGLQEVVVAGRMTPTANTSDYADYNLTVWGWKNGSFQNVTNTYFSGSDAVVKGTEPSVHFADFNGDGKKDIYIAPSTDSAVFGSDVAFFDTGTGFRRVDIATNTYAHDAAVYDLNGDGRSDIVGTNLNFYFGRADSTFDVYYARSLYGGGSGIGVADFMGDGTSSIIIADSSDGTNLRNRLFGWSQDTHGLINMNKIADLPISVFMQPQWADYKFKQSHDVRVLPFDFDNSGRTSAVIFGRPDQVTEANALNADWMNMSSVQFLKNMGSGNFVDVTSSTLVGYNYNTHATYNPQLFDVNSDGLMDIVLSNSQWKDVKGVQVLVHTKEHKYVSSYTTVLQAFQNQAIDIEKALGSANAQQGSNGVVFINGPDSNLYIATAVDYTENNVGKKSIYISKLGSNTMNAQATATAIKQAWPWMSDAQVNTVLAQSSTNWLNMSLLDSQKALSAPIGQLGVYVNGQMRPLSGSLGGISLNGAANNFTIFDSTNRAWSVNYSSSNYNMTHFWGQNIHDPILDDTRSAVGMKWTGMQMAQMSLAQARGTMGFNQSTWGSGWFDEAVIKMGSNQFKDMTNPYSGTAPQMAYAYAITNVKPLSDRNFAINAQYTNLPFSPFVQMSGVWGQVSSADMFEMSASYRYKGLIGKMGLINSYTNIQGGLVNSVTPINSVWGEVGHEWSAVKAYVGVLPKIVSGTANISMPTGVDRSGNTQYTNVNAGVNNPLVGYARVQMFNFTDRYKTKSYTINGIVSTDNNKAIMANYTHRF